MVKATSLIFLVDLVFLFQGVYPQRVRTISEDAVAGTQWVFPNNSSGSGTVITVEDGNTAKSISGIANAGQRIIFGRGTSVTDSNVTHKSNISQNVATSNLNKAVGGFQMVVDNYVDSTINRQTSVSNNEASVIGVDSGVDKTAVSGVQSLVTSVVGSSLFLNDNSFNNTASNNNNGNAIAGVEQVFGSVSDTYIQQSNQAQENFATAGDGSSVAGLQGGASIVSDSTIMNNGQSRLNQAKAVNGNAVAGIDNSFGTLQGVMPGGAAIVNLNTQSSDNIATAVDGKAIAGVGTNVVQMNRSVVIQDATAENNKAVVSGEGNIPKLSVAGVNVVVQDMDQSLVRLNVSSNGNQAFNYHYDPNFTSDAVSGLQVTIGNAESSTIVVLANSTDNFAHAIYGDAVAGNKLNILDSTSDTIVSTSLEAENNYAIADNGDAIVNNNVTVGGDGHLIK
eukprot:TRINITY_DN2173_c0_g1_i10.p1 TRINITY_DN2173_c0_g1~~TRINITY_DN2173_c0_g1_i10.p1  ORF type:complete len:485 (-),score=57.76 TRINITY_DN2173_c0_g1_i10:527-1879(-)